MKDFDYKKYLAEGRLLNEAELTDDLVQRVAQAVADEFTAEDRELDLKYVITPNSIEADPRGGGFDLDVNAGPNTPGDDWKDSRGFSIANYLGDYAGGSFVIRPEGNGHLVTNAASRNAKVAYITPEGEIEIISAADSKADLGMTNDVETDYMERRKEMSDYMNEAYTPGLGWTKDFDYDGMLSLALKLNADSPMDLLQKVSSDLEDVNYHRENSYLTDAIDAIKDGDRVEAKIAINRFRKEVKTNLNEGIFDRAKAKIKGAATGIKTAVGNVAAAAKGNKDAIKDTALEVGLTKLKVKATTLNKDLDKVISDIDKLFHEKKLEKNPKLANIIDQYKISLENAKTQNAKIGKIEMKESEITETLPNKTKMKKSELKEMIKMALSEDARTDAEQEGYKDGFDDAKDDIEAKLKDMKVSEAEEVNVLSNEFLQDIQDTMKMYYKMDVDMDDIKDWVKFYYIDYNSEYDNEEDKKELVFDTAEREDFYMHLNPEADSTFPIDEAEEVDVEDNEKVDVDIEKDVEVDDESVETDIDVKGSMPGEDSDEIAVQSLLMKAQEEAEKLGDEKLTDQIGNTITYFTRAHVATVDEAEEMDEIAALPGSTGVEDVNVDDPAEDAMVGLTERLRWQRIAGIAKDNGLYSK